MISKPFLYSNALMAKSCTQILSFKSMTEVDEYEDNSVIFIFIYWRTKNTELFRPGGAWSPEINQTWHGYRGTCHSCTSSHSTHSLAATGAEHLGDSSPSNFKHYNSKPWANPPKFWQMTENEAPRKLWKFCTNRPMDTPRRFVCIPKMRNF